MVILISVFFLSLIDRINALSQPEMTCDMNSKYITFGNLFKISYIRFFMTKEIIIAV